MGVVEFTIKYLMVFYDDSMSMANQNSYINMERLDYFLIKFD